MLLGWVEETPCKSDWLRLVRCAIPPENFIKECDHAEMLNPETRYMSIRGAGMEMNE